MWAPAEREARRARFVERGGVVPPHGTEASALLEALLGSGELLPGLLHDRPQDVVSPRDLPPLARTFGLRPEMLTAQLDAAMTRVRAIFDSTFTPD